MAETVLIEILSADPIGPLSLAQGRTAVQGDILARLLAFTGANVRREYYVNEMGQRATVLCDTVRHCILSDTDGDEVEGRYDRTVREVAERLREDIGQKIAQANEEEWRGFCEERVPEVLLALQRQTLDRLGVQFDIWFEEKTLSREAVQEVIGRLEKSDATLVIGGALWLENGHNRTLLRRENGDYTYFAMDIAYHLSKIERGADRMLDVWGSAYHRHRSRLQEAMSALGAETPLEVLVSGGVRFENDGLPVNYLDASTITVHSLLESGSADNLRYRLNAAPPENDLVLEVDALNAASLPLEIRALRKAAEGAPVSSLSDLQGAVEGNGQGSRLLSLAQKTPEIILSAAKDRRPDRLNAHLAALAQALEQKDVAQEERNAVGAASASLLHVLGLTGA